MAAAPMPDQFREILRGALSLSPEDQSRLCSVLQDLTGSRAEPSVIDAGGDVGPVPQRDVQEWLKQIEGEPPWDQLLLLEGALEVEDAPNERAALEAARSQLLRTHTPIAVRRAVTELAARSPLGVCVGVLGLLVGVVGIGRLLLRVLF